ncbi:unnamed protein product, partial [Tetraodon nigroviridis]
SAVNEDQACCEVVVARRRPMSYSPPSTPSRTPSAKRRSSLPNGEGPGLRLDYSKLGEVHTPDPAVKTQHQRTETLSCPSAGQRGVCVPLLGPVRRSRRLRGGRGGLPPAAAPHRLPAAGRHRGPAPSRRAAPHRAGGGAGREQPLPPGKRPGPSPGPDTGRLAARGRGDARVPQQHAASAALLQREEDRAREPGGRSCGERLQRDGCPDREGKASVQRHGRLHSPRRCLPAGKAVRGQRRRQQVRPLATFSTSPWDESLVSGLHHRAAGCRLCAQGHHHQKQRDPSHVLGVHARVRTAAASVP